MSEQENSGSERPADEPASPRELDIIIRNDEPKGASRDRPHGPTGGPTRMLAVLPARRETRLPEFEPFAPSQIFVRSCLAVAAAAALAGAVTAAVALVNEHHRQDNLLTEHAHETESLAQSVKALNARLDAIESAKLRDELADLRRSIGEVKSSIASARDLNGALAQLSQRLEKLDHDESAKLEKLGERVDHEASSRAAELLARIEKLERRPMAPVVAAAPTPTPPGPSPTKQPVPPIRSSSNVSIESTGSIPRPRPVLQGYIVLDAQGDIALVSGRYGEREVRLGDFLPGAGRVERIERQGHRWVVLTNEGLIAAAEPPLD